MLRVHLSGHMFIGLIMAALFGVSSIPVTRALPLTQNDPCPTETYEPGETCATPVATLTSTPTVAAGD